MGWWDLPETQVTQADDAPLADDTRAEGLFVRRTPSTGVEPTGPTGLGGEGHT